ncbi:MAG: sigma-54 dependent transcriptional regulator [Myxococcota bacterium]
MSEAPRETVIIAEARAESADRLRRLLQAEGWQVLVCASARELLALLPELRPRMLFISLEMPDLPGPDLLTLLKERARGLPLVAITQHESVPRAVAALQAGAVDLLTLPISPSGVRASLKHAQTDDQGRSDLRRAREAASDREGFSHMLTRSPRMLRVFEQIRAVASTDATVLIRGETGTGKELVARAIHEHSRRQERPLISVNCGAFTETLLESELFGHEKGSFTSASGRRRGVFEMADGGTLFLDELGETSLSVQVSLLRVLETTRFRRVGGHEEVDVDVRIIAATHVGLEEAVKRKSFREDLFYRLNVFPITLPPLRERREDIPLLLRHFFEHAAQAYGLSEPPAISATAMEAILRYDWPGNVRQLRSLCERWVIVANGREVTAEMLPEPIRTGGPPKPADPADFHVEDGVPMKVAVDRMVSQLERTYLHRLLQRNHGRLSQTAQAAGITRRTLYNKMKAYRLDADDYR